MKPGIDFLPASSIFIDQKVSIRDAVNIMKKSGSRAVLVFEDESEFAEAIGIFTERDFVNKSAYLSNPRNWNRPIRAVMSKPVKFLSIKDMHKLSEFMVDHRVRSVPIIGSGRALNRKNVIGVANIFDLIEDQVRAERQKKTKRGITMIGVLSDNHRYCSYVWESLKSSIKVRCFPIDARDHDDVAAGRCEWLIIDLDHFSLETIMPILKQARRLNQKTILLFDEVHLPQKMRSILEIRSGGKDIILMRKPLSPNDLKSVILGEVQSDRFEDL